MKQIVNFFIVIISSLVGCLVLTSYSFDGSNSSSDSYDIAGIFEKVEVPDGSKVLISFDGLKETDAIFVPSKLETGKYTVDVTRVRGTSTRSVTPTCTSRPGTAMNMRPGKRWS